MQCVCKSLIYILFIGLLFSQIACKKKSIELQDPISVDANDLEEEIKLPENEEDPQEKSAHDENLNQGNRIKRPVPVPVLPPVPAPVVPVPVPVPLPAPIVDNDDGGGDDEDSHHHHVPDLDCTSDCDDGNVCTEDTCDDGACEYTPQSGLYCALNNDLCTFGLCQRGECVAYQRVNCDNENPCTIQSCNPNTGNCDSTNKTNGTPCNDDNPCTNNTTCTDGVCGGGTNVCPLGACPNCDDDNPCTNDMCNGGTCVNTPTPGLFCQFEDNLCDLGECNDDGECVLFYTKSCVSSNPCATQSCNTDTGNCTVATSLPDGTDCSAFCPANHTVPSPTCLGGLCICDEPPGCSTNCDDNNPCTNDICNGTVCEHIAQIGLYCEVDNNLCTYGLCADIEGVPTCNENKNVVCDSDNPCVALECNIATGICEAQSPNPNDGISCNDNNACTNNDVCLNGQCAGTAISCDDSNSCTDDFCSTPKGCQNTPRIGSLCEIDLCTIGVCTTVVDATICSEFQTKTCDNDDPCTLKTCNAATGDCDSTNLDNGTPCDDNDFCTLNTICTDGVCGGGTVQSCNDSNPCTEDICYPNGCQNIAQPGIYCEIDKCTFGTCQAVDDSISCQAFQSVKCDNDNPCTSQACNPLTGNCDITNLVGTSCDDSNPCTINTTCTNGLCGGGTVLSCDDSNICTDDLCTPNGCTNINLNGPSSIPCTAINPVLNIPYCGICSQGFTACNEGQLANIPDDPNSCIPVAYPNDIPEICNNGLDDNCDCETDAADHDDCDPLFVFVTQIPSVANFGSTAIADSICTNIAITAGFSPSSVWVAGVSDTLSSFQGRLGRVTRPYYLRNKNNIGQTGPILVAFNYDDLFDGLIQHPIDQNDLDFGIPLGTMVWTGSLPDGSQSGSDCTNWSSTLGNGTIGDPTQIGASWLQSGTDACAATHNFYCFQKP